MKKVINCLKEDNPVINKKLKEVSIDEGLSIAKSTVNRGLSEASPINSADWKYDHDSIATKTTINM